MNTMDLLPEKSQLPILNLDEELYERNNVVIAFLVIISGLIKNKEQRQEILEKIRPGYIGLKLERYLYEIIADDLERTGEIDIQSIVERIPEFGPKVYGMSSDKHSLEGDYFTLAQILDFQPTPAQVSKAIEMAVDVAKSEQSRLDQEEG